MSDKKPREFDIVAANSHRQAHQFKNTETLLKLANRPDLADMMGFLDGAKWQFEKDQEAYAALEEKLAECVAVLEYIQNDMPKKAKEKFDKNEVTYFCVDADAEVLDPRFEHAILAREVLAKVKKLKGDV